MLTFAPIRCLAVPALAVALALVAAPAAHAQVFSNNAAITIPAPGDLRLISADAIGLGRNSTTFLESSDTPRPEIPFITQ
jgi:hypothetical protein